MVSVGLNYKNPILIETIISIIFQALIKPPTYMVNPANFAFLLLNGSLPDCEFD